MTPAPSTDAEELRATVAALKEHIGKLWCAIVVHDQENQCVDCKICGSSWNDDEPEYHRHDCPLANPPESAPSPGACQPPQWQEMNSAPHAENVLLLMADGQQVGTEYVIEGYHSARAWRTEMHVTAEPIGWLPRSILPLHRPAPPRGEKEE
jgi:hypothetical protein